MVFVNDSPFVLDLAGSLVVRVFFFLWRHLGFLCRSLFLYCDARGVVVSCRLLCLHWVMLFSGRVNWGCSYWGVLLLYLCVFLLFGVWWEGMVGCFCDFASVKIISVELWSYCWGGGRVRVGFTDRGVFFRLCVFRGYKSFSFTIIRTSYLTSSCGRDGTLSLKDLNRNERTHIFK